VRIIQGKKIADRILADLKEEIKAKKIKPVLAVILVGHNPASRLYLRLKEKAAQKVGIKIKNFTLPSKISEKKILEIIASLNEDSKINGILVQLPLPKGLSPDKIIKEIIPSKDVDGFVKESHFQSPFILAIWQVLLVTGENLKNKKAIALVNSDVFGQALCRFLKRKGLKAKYVLGALLPLVTRVDILIAALGQPNFVKGSMVKEGVILIDGGITKRKRRVIGDIDRKSVSKKAKWLSPAPGGLGPMTVAFLLKNVVLAANKTNKVRL